MAIISRRKFGQLAGASAAVGAIGAPTLLQAATPKVVVIGGGAGGATAARYVAMGSKGAIEVTLIEPTKKYYTCFFSNLYLGGVRDYESIGHTYDKLAIDHGINVIHDWAVSVDREKKMVVLSSGAMVPYDRLIVSPGIDLKYESNPGYSVESTNAMPHAWKSGSQVQLLKAQVENMKEGGTFVMVPPPNPFRCPPGPYERVSMIAKVFKEKNPTAKIVVLDTKEKFSKQGLFTAGWETHYDGMIEWIPPSVHGGIKKIDHRAMTIETDLDTFNADAACVIPANTSGKIASIAGLTDDSGWCPIVPATMQSTLDENIHVIGDSSIAKSMPKSGFSANSQAKVAAAAARSALTGSKVFGSKFANTCWSLIAPDDGIKVGAAYEAGDKKIDVTSKFISKGGEDADTRKTTYEESVGWYDAISADMFG